MEYRSYVGRDFCEHWVGRSAGKLTAGGCMRRAATKSRRGVFAVTQVEGCLEFICRNGAALCLCFPIGGVASCRLGRTQTQTQTTRVLNLHFRCAHASDRVTVCVENVENAYFDQIIGLLQKTMHTFLILDRAIFKAAIATRRTFFSQYR